MQLPWSPEPPVGTAVQHVRVAITRTLTSSSLQPPHYIACSPLLPMPSAPPLPLALHFPPIPIFFYLLWLLCRLVKGCTASARVMQLPLSPESPAGTAVQST